MGVKTARAGVTLRQLRIAIARAVAFDFSILTCTTPTAGRCNTPSIGRQHTAG